MDKELSAQQSAARAEAIAAYRRKPAPIVLHGVVQHYAWGGMEAIPSLLQIDNSRDKKPYAELWIGAHPKAPSRASLAKVELPLTDLLDGAAEEILGPETSLRFGKTLPYLFKVLDARRMLSIQAHPNKSQAEAEFAEENRRGVPLDSANRNYNDANHKPEVHVALTDFWLLHGFRPLEEIAEALRNVPEFRALMPSFEKRLEEAGSDEKRRRELIRGLYRRIMDDSLMPQGEVDATLDPLIARLETLDGQDKLSKGSPEYWTVRASRELPLKGSHRDRGIFSIHLLNLLHLKPGEATYQAAGVPHAYLEGTTMELMANSDNVLRGGLTPKRVDASALVKTLTFESGKPQVIAGRKLSPTERVYETPSQEFEISRIEATAATPHVNAPRHSMDSLVVIEGTAEVVHRDGAMPLEKGGILLIPAGMPYEIRTKDRTVVFKAAVPLKSKP